MFNRGAVTQSLRNNCMFNRGAVTQSLWNNGGAVTQSLRNNRGAVTQSLLPCELDRVCCTRASASVVRDFNVCVLTNQDLIRQQHFHERSCSTFNLTKFSFSRVQVPWYTASHSPFSNQKGLSFLIRPCRGQLDPLGAD
jgi:hypothetical protein